jgi:hypothetical protein
VWYNGWDMRSVPIASLFRAVLRRPSLWGEAMRTIPALARRGWWKHRPFLPLPDGDYLGWRIATAYGDSDGPIPAADIVAYLEWRRRQHHR